MMNNDDKISEIETKVTFLEDALEKLSNEFYQQQLELTKLQGANQQLREKLSSIENQSELGGMVHINDEKPPHY